MLLEVRGRSGLVIAREKSDASIVRESGVLHHGCSLNKFQSFVKILVIYQSFHDLESRGFDIRMESLSSTH